MTQFADLHIHTYYSDGTDSPQEVVQQACRAGLSCIAIADHDTVEGIAPVQQEAASCQLEVIPAIELSTEIDKKDVHILGYLFDPENEILRGKLRSFQDIRVERIRKMLEKLKDQGINNIALEDVCQLARSKAVGRPHLAAMLIDKGWVRDKRQAFERYLGEECPAYVPKFQQTPHEAIQLIRQAGGIAVMAHPMVTRKDELIPAFVEAGLGGIEVYYPNYPPSIIQFYAGIAKKYDLVMTGGSDAHGGNKSNTHVGKIKISYDLVEKLRDRCRSAQGR